MVVLCQTLSSSQRLYPKKDKESFRLISTLIIYSVISVLGVSHQGSVNSDLGLVP